MRVYFLLISCCLLLGSSCDTTTPATDQPPVKNEVSEESAVDNRSVEIEFCPALTALDPGERLHIPSQNIQLGLSGELNQQALSAYRSADCGVIYQKMVPTSKDGNDVQYTFARINYSRAHQLIGLKGRRDLLLFDLKEKNWTGPLYPKFSGERMGADAQSGNILRLEVWEHYLVGQAMDFGPFVFDLSDRVEPQAVMPVTRYAGEQEDRMLFLLRSQDGRYQAIMPHYTFEGNDFQVNPVFKEPVAIHVDTQDMMQDGQYLVLTDKNGRTFYPIDLASGEAIDLPVQPSLSNMEAVQAWLKTYSSGK